MIRNRFAVLTLLIVALACDSSLAPRQPIDATFVYARAWALEAPPGATAPPTVTTDGGALTVLGTHMTSLPCYSLEARATRIDVTVRVRLIAERGDGICTAVSADWAYRLTLTLPHQAERLVMEHAVRSNGRTGPFAPLFETTLDR